jgi:hypothetical protein
MEETRIKIYQSIVKYLLETTPYTLQHIAELTDSSIKSITSIYSGIQMNLPLSCEIQLIQLYRIILECNPNENGNIRIIPPC